MRNILIRFVTILRNISIPSILHGSKDRSTWIIESGYKEMIRRESDVLTEL